jgi:hypothetical protein
MYDENGERSGFTVIAEGKSFGVPIDPANRHYAEIMRQMAEEGLVIAEPD